MGEVEYSSGAGASRWIDVRGLTARAGMAPRCTEAAITAALHSMANVRVRSVRFNDSGIVDTDTGEVRDLPDFYDVRLEVASPGGRSAQVLVWLPTHWNERYLGTGGGGNRTMMPWTLPDFMSIITPPIALRNGFATSATDAGNRDPRPAAWGLDLETMEIDWDLTENWFVRSTHEMTQIAQLVIAHAYGQPAEFSYFAGTSGGGRQALALAQQHADDFDGIWADCPAIHWSRVHVAQMWPALVMKEHGNPLSPPKLAHFRARAIDELKAGDISGPAAMHGNAFATWDAARAIGDETADGVITELDATVMQRIWEGPRSKDGTWLWFGPTIEAEFWGDNFLGMGLACTETRGEQLVPVPFQLSVDWIASWLLRSPEWNWTALTFSQFEALFAQSVAEFGHIDSADPDLAGLKRAGGKLLLTQGVADGVMPAGGALRYFSSVIAQADDRESVDDFIRFFLFPGGQHSILSSDAPNVSIASGMTALMDWVEKDNAPEVITGYSMNQQTHELTMRRPVSRYIFG